MSIHQYQKTTLNQSILGGVCYVDFLACPNKPEKSKIEKVAAIIWKGSPKKLLKFIKTIAKSKLKLFQPRSEKKMPNKDTKTAANDLPSEPTPKRPKSKIRSLVNSPKYAPPMRNYIPQTKAGITEKLKTLASQT